ncbi:MAG: sulfurtransferase TusA family protein [Promethearchaeota archaeon]
MKNEEEENKKNQNQNKNQITEIKISKFQMFLKFARIILYLIVGKRKWVLPAIPEITVDQLHERINSNQAPVIIDVRDTSDFDGVEGSNRKYGHISNAMNIPIMQFSAHLLDLSAFQDKEIVTICPGGGMSLAAAEILGKAGFTDAKSLTGGMDLWHKKGYPTIITDDSSLSDTLGFREIPKISEGKKPLVEIPMSKVNKTLDARNLTCPLPILKSRKALTRLKDNQVLEILTTDPASWSDIPAWAQVSGNGLISAEETGPREYRFLVKKIAIH